MEALKAIFGAVILFSIIWFAMTLREKVAEKANESRERRRNS